MLHTIKIMIAVMQTLISYSAFYQMCQLIYNSSIIEARDKCRNILVEPHRGDKCVDILLLYYL